MSRDTLVPLITMSYQQIQQTVYPVQKSIPQQKVMPQQAIKIEASPNTLVIWIPVVVVLISTIGGIIIAFFRRRK